MYTISGNVVNEIIINKSRFIGLLYIVHSKDDVKKYMNIVKNKYRDATHYCYAYIIDSNIKCSDDGEPSKTAGSPILNVLEMKHLNHILCIVVRYFGGIKLGSGGLVRAYSDACSSALNLVNVKELVKGKKVRLKIEYSDVDKINYILKDKRVIYKEFSDQVIYEVLLDNDSINDIKMFNYEELEDVYITK